MIPESLIRQMQNARTRLTRLSDAKLFSGWIQSISGTSVAVGSLPDGKLNPGEIFSFEVYGDKVTAHFRASLNLISSATAEFQVVGVIKLIQSTEARRIKLTGVMAVIQAGSKHVDAEVCDASSSGLGILTHEAIEKGAVVDVKVQSSSGQMDFQAEVRYCRPEPNGDGAFRIGLLITDMSRIFTSRWAKLIESGNLAA